MATDSGREFRSIDGSGNNLEQTAWGSAGTDFLRKAGAHYADGVATPAGDARPGAREVSNAVYAQAAPIPDARGASDVLWLWGQFLDHDITLTKGAGTPEAFDIPIPKGDPYFDPLATGTAVMPFVRSGFAPDSGTGPGDPREQVNEITAYIDASMIYGSDAARAAFLRGDGGKLKLGEDGHLPFHDGSLPDAPQDGSVAFAAGDVRANENVALTAMQTLFAREHNRLVDELAVKHPDYDAERLYQEAKALVEAKIQAITYNEFLPLLLGKDALPGYDGYRSDVDPGIGNMFATAAYRVGHTMLGSTIWRVEENADEAAFGHLALRDAFFRPDRILNEGGVDPILRGVALGHAQAIDASLVDDVRNFLFGAPGSGGLDLAALNIQRGRDHGLASYNETREAYGLTRVASFSEITEDRGLQAILRDLYGSVEQIDVWVGGLAEDLMPGAMVGELFQAVLVDQFVQLRDGDRFWYQSRFSGDALEAIEETSLAAIIKLNSGIDYIQDNVFLAYDRIGGTEGADRLTGDGGQDLIIGFAGDDRLAGRGGDDQLHGGDGRDELFGGAGDDRLDGGPGRDELRGGGGQDHLLQAGADLLEAGPGSDAVEITDQDFRSIDGGPGFDRLIVDFDDQADLDLTRLASRRISDIEQIDLGHDGDDRLVLSLQDLIDLTASDNRLLVEGEAGDRVISTGQGWTETGRAEIDGVTYTTFCHAKTGDDGYGGGWSATLLVDQDMVSSDVS